MGRIFRSMVLIFVFAATSIQHLSAAETHEAAAVRIRIHDYANVRSATLARAQHIVSRMYGAIGVHTEWLAPMRPRDEDSGAGECMPTDITIILLTPEMAKRRTVPNTVIGYAAVTRGEGGRVAFVIYDRVRSLARDARADAMHVMGMVMAHELGHLLMPDGSHSDEGLMRARWVRADFRRLDPLDLRFTLGQVEEIRRTVGVATAAAP